MATIPTAFARVPNLLSSRMMMGNLTRTNSSLMGLQSQLATGIRVMRPSVDPVAASTITSLDFMIEQREQHLRNLNHADSLLATIDQSLGDISDLILEAKGIGLSQIGVGSDAETRANQAQVVDSILQSLADIANREQGGIHFFGGEAVSSDPMAELNGFYRYVGFGDSMQTDLGMAAGVGVTISAESALGAMSARVRGAVDLDPGLESSTRISEIRGARGLGIELGSLRAEVNGVELVIDLSEADTIGDVRAILQNELKTVDVFASVSLAGGSLQVSPSLGLITFSDLDGGTIAEDLGLVGSYIPGATSSGLDLDPELTELTSIASLPGVTLPMGSIRIENGGQVRVVDLSEVTTVGELFSAVDELQIGVRAEIDEDGRRINFRNELSGAHLSISEVAGGETATQLGIRSLSGSTLLSDFNDGRGVGSVSGGFDPVTGLPDPSLDLDFEITLSDGTSFGVDVSGAATVSDVLDAINAAAADQGIPVPGAFSADLMADGNGIELRDQLGGGGSLTVSRLNNSTAAADLGILGEGTGAVLAGTDQAQVAADGLFTHLAALRDALLANDEAGIAFATEQLDADTLLVAEARAEVGVRSRRVTDSLAREEDRSIQDQSLRSTLRDLDFTEAATRFALLQQQLQASMATIGQTQQLSLLDFLR
ncbi:MAG: flagellin [Planctomycetota bacterium]|nr:flagellin [Planctomycetota bacterium]